VDLVPDHAHSGLIRISGLTVELRNALDHDVDLFATEMMKYDAAASAICDAIPL
jgi:hypothetical protein